MALLEGRFRLVTCVRHYLKALNTLEEDPEILIRGAGKVVILGTQKPEITAEGSKVWVETENRRDRAGS